jgi:hypothetical protein
MMRKTWIVLPLSLLLAGCPGEERTDTVVVTDTPTVAPGTTAPATPAPGAGAMSATVQMNPIGGAAVSGEATVTDMGNQTQVMVRLTGSQPNATHQGHIHSGTCASPGGRVTDLQPITTDGTGTGTMTTTVDLPPMTVMNGQHLIQYHAPDGQPGPGVVCGDIPGHQM